jgi:hypothetical protein
MSFAVDGHDSEIMAEGKPARSRPAAIICAARKNITSLLAVQGMRWAICADARKFRGAVSCPKFWLKLWLGWQVNGAKVTDRFEFGRRELAAEFSERMSGELP